MREKKGRSHLSQAELEKEIKFMRDEFELYLIAPVLKREMGKQKIYNFFAFWKFIFELIFAFTFIIALGVLAYWLSGGKLTIWNYLGIPYLN